MSSGIAYSARRSRGWTGASDRSDAKSGYGSRTVPAPETRLNSSNGSSSSSGADVRDEVWRSSATDRGYRLPECRPMRLHYDEETERFRAELDAWLDANAPTPADMTERPRSSAHLPDWARRWQRAQFDAG